MPLPKLETPTYTLQIPSTKETIEFRPFLVKEEKILMIAQESKDLNQINSTIEKIIDQCTFGKVKAGDLTTYDVEYIFIQLRAKSVGESVQLKVKCKECGKENDVSIDLTKISVIFPETQTPDKIELTDSVGIILKPFNFKDARKLNNNDLNSVIAAAIKSIYDQDNIYDPKDVTKKEMDEFIDSLSHKNLESIKDYINNQPTLKHTITFKCAHCGEDNSIELSNISDFFT